MKKIKYIQDIPKVCCNCEHSDRSYTKIDRWYCGAFEGPKMRVSENKPGCEYFELDYELDVKTRHLFTHEQVIKI